MGKFSALRGESVGQRELWAVKLVKSAEVQDALSSSSELQPRELKGADRRSRESEQEDRGWR